MAAEASAKNRDLKKEYKEALQSFKEMVSVKTCKETMKLWKALGDYKDAAEYLQKCKDKEPLFVEAENLKKQLDKAEGEVRKKERELAKVRKEHSREENALSPIQSQLMQDFDLLEVRRTAYDARMVTYNMDVAEIEEEYKKEAGELAGQAHTLSERVRTLTNKKADLENQLRSTFALDFKRKKMLAEDIEIFTRDIEEAKSKAEEAESRVSIAEEHRAKKMALLNAEIAHLQGQVEEVKERIAFAEQMAVSANSKTSVREGLVFGAEGALEQAEAEADRIRAEWEALLDKAKE